MWIRFLRAGGLALMLICLALGDVQARTFYVNAARGDDTQDGLEPETAWRSLARVNRASLSPGDRVLFRRGQAWRGQLIPHSGDVSGVVTYGAFGEGAKPILLGSAAADQTEDWQAAGSGIWASDISFIGGGHQMTRPDGKPVRYGNGIEFWSDAHDCLVEDCRLWEIYDAALTNQGDGTNVQENITYRGNVIWKSEYSFEYWNRGPASRTRNIVFEHNTCVDAGLGWGHRQRPDPNGRHLMFYDNSASTTNVVIRNNVFCGATDSLLRLQGRDWTGGLEMDHNCWFQPRGPVLLWGRQALGADESAAFMHSRGFDHGSVFADPRFVDAAEHDYRLAPDSPARGLAGQGKPAGAFPD